MSENMGNQPVYVSMTDEEVVNELQLIHGKITDEEKKRRRSWIIIAVLLVFGGWQYHRNEEFITARDSARAAVCQQDNKQAVAAANVIEIDEDTLRGALAQIDHPSDETTKFITDRIGVLEANKPHERSCDPESLAEYYAGK